jgi:hypothetical protein
LDSWFKSYGVLKFLAYLWACCQPLANAIEFAQISPKPSKIAKFAQRQLAWRIMKSRQKIEIVMFLRN